MHVLDNSQISLLLKTHPDWSFDGLSLYRKFTFHNDLSTMSFANAVAWIAHRLNHHPQMTICFKTCHLAYHTHSVQGITALDQNSINQVDSLIHLNDAM